ncbi:MAG: ankyrin repeat domain-containing protein [Candidatus Midichloria sp.]|nr:MAG: ankyrin repeat domain-containing protein [Candidatus Midichloria sp.]
MIAMESSQNQLLKIGLDKIREEIYNKDLLNTDLNQWLYYAVVTNHKEMVEFLINQRASINHIEQQDSMLHCAIRKDF